MRIDATPRQPVLVTGASGFIGGRLVRRLLACGHPVTCLVRAHSRVDELRSTGAQLATGDVADRDSVARVLALSRPCTVFHLAGRVKAVPGRTGRDEFMRVNRDGVENVAAACADRALLPNPPVLVVVSSLAAAGPSDPAQPRVESDTPAPVSSYGRSKLAGERAAAKYAAAAPITIVRPAIVFGPSDQGVLQIFRPIARWGVHIVPGMGIHRYSLIHVDDLVEGLLLAAEKGERLAEHGTPGQGIYFMAGNDHPTYAQLGCAMSVALGRKPPAVVHLPGPLVRLAGIVGDNVSRIRRRAGWVSRDKTAEALAGSWTCSSEKAHAHLDWSPAAGLVDRLREAAQWYRHAGWL